MHSLKEMKQKAEVPAAQPSLLLLNEDDHLEIFKFLTFEDSINLAGSCRGLRSVADRLFKKYSNFQLDSTIVNQGQKYIDYVFSYIGQHVISLKLDCRGVHLNLKEVLCQIKNDCKNLKCLGIDNWKGDSQNVSFVYSFDNVQMLTLRRCNSNFTKSFLLNFTKLISLNILCSSIEQFELETVFRNNPNIESFVHWNFDQKPGYNCQLLKMIPNVVKLKLNVYDFGDNSEANTLLKLHRLTKLRLYCRGQNLNNVLRVLVKNGIMEEIELYNVDANDHCFDILRSFDKLQLLAIETSGQRKLKSSIVWPTKLTQLRLENFQLIYNDLIEMIQQIKNIDSIDVRGCGIAVSDQTSFNDVAKMLKQILHIMDNTNRKQRLNVFLPYYAKPAAEYRSSNYLFDHRVQISYRTVEFDSLEIGLHFPD